MQHHHRGSGTQKRQAWDVGGGGGQGVPQGALRPCQAAWVDVRQPGAWRWVGQRMVNAWSAYGDECREQAFIRQKQTSTTQTLLTHTPPTNCFPHRARPAAQLLHASSSCAPAASPGAGCADGAGVSSCTCVAASGALLAVDTYAASIDRSCTPSRRACVSAAGSGVVGWGGAWGLVAPACSLGPCAAAMWASSRRCMVAQGGWSGSDRGSRDATAAAARRACVASDDCVGMVCDGVCVWGVVQPSEAKEALGACGDALMPILIVCTSRGSEGFKTLFRHSIQSQYSEQCCCPTSFRGRLPPSPGTLPTARSRPARGAPGTAA